MEVPFNTLPDTARIWIYQSNRPFNKNERKILCTNLSSFLQGWTAHGSELKASFDLPYDHFVVIGLDEGASDASGCSIDGLFRMLRETGIALGIDFLNRELIAFKKSEGIKLVARKDLKEFLAVAGGRVLTFNNLVANKKALQHDWLVAADTTWMKRYIAPISV
jgi:hypothetical protein